LQRLEGAYITGYGDGSSPVLDAEPLTPLPGADTAAKAVLEGHQATRDRIARVLDLAVGFDSMYGMELLATVHWVCAQEDARTIDEVVRAVHEWSPRKADLFTDRHIEIARQHLFDQGWLSECSVSP